MSKWVDGRWIDGWMDEWRESLKCASSSFPIIIFWEIILRDKSEVEQRFIHTDIHYNIANNRNHRKQMSKLGK